MCLAERDEMQMGRRKGTTHHSFIDDFTRFEVLMSAVCFLAAFWGPI